MNGNETTTPVDTESIDTTNTELPTMKTQDGEVLTPETATEEQVAEAIKTTEEHMGLDIQSMFLANSQGDIARDLATGLNNLVRKDINELQRKFLIEKLGLKSTTTYDDCLVACVKAGYRINMETLKHEAGSYSFELQLLKVDIKETYKVNCKPNTDYSIA